MTPVSARTCSPCRRKGILSGGGTGYKPAPAKGNTPRGAHAGKGTRLGCITIAELNGTDTTALQMILVRQNSSVVPQDDDGLLDYVPDANFQAVLLATSVTKTPEGIITVATAKAYNPTTGLSIYNNISSLVSIELFTSLEKLYLGAGSENVTTRNRTEVLDFSHNAALTYMDAKFVRELLVADISACPNFSSLIVSYAKLGDLDFTANLKLTLLNCNGGITSSGTADVGRLRNVNITGCPDLTNLQLVCNHLTELDLSNNTKLATTVYLRRNHLKTLDASGLENVTTLNLKDNALESIILPVRTNATTLTLNVDNTTDYGSDKMFNNLSMVDASKTFGVYQIDVSRNPNCTTIYFPISHDNTNVRVTTAAGYINVSTSNATTTDGVNVILIDPNAAWSNSRSSSPFTVPSTDERAGRMAQHHR
jgi:hypothetical protein